MSKKEDDILLERIANHLIIQTSAMDDIGLYYGKIGIVLFFAHYSRYTGCSVYEDFADELLDTIIENEDYILKKKSFKDVTLTHVKILKESKKLNKKAGNYLSVDFQNIYEATSRHHISDVLTKALSQIHKIKKNEKILIVGLGNNNIIADSLGPAVCDKIVVTNHLFKLFPEEIDKDTKKVCVFTPKVMGQTGLESSDLIKAICNLFNPFINSSL